MRSKWIMLIVIILVLTAGFLFYQMTRTDNVRIRKMKNNIATTKIAEITETSAVAKRDLSEYIKLSDSMLITGLAQDSIPPLESPEYTTVEEANNFLEDWDQVFVLEGMTHTYIYPQKIMVWHEIVNEEIDGEAISITYCPLTASAIGYIGEEGNTYGTSGNLLNSNLVMYDRKSNSNIPQILGVGVDSDLSGVTLKTKPILWADWADVAAMYPKANVLSLETSHTRDYFQDPYGSYSPLTKTSYYQTGEPMFPLLNDNLTDIDDKKVVVGVKYDKNVIALDPNKVEEMRVLNFEVGNHPAVAIYDTDLKTVRVYSAMLADKKITLKYIEKTIFDESGREWQAKGVSKSGESLTPITHFDVFWFAWQAYYSSSEIIE